MKVTNKIGPNAPKVDAGKSPKVDGKTSAGGTAGSEALSGTKSTKASSENVNVSERAQMMQKAKDIASDPSIDQAKVARLQKLIDEGKYKTDAKAIADKLVDEHLSIPE